METAIRYKAKGMSEENRKIILEDIKAKVENTKKSISESFVAHQSVINEQLDELLDRIRDLKVAPIANDGSIQNE